MMMMMIDDLRWFRGDGITYYWCLDFLYDGILV